MASSNTASHKSFRNPILRDKDRMNLLVEENKRLEAELASVRADFLRVAAFVDRLKVPA